MNDSLQFFQYPGDIFDCPVGNSVLNFRFSLGHGKSHHRLFGSSDPKICVPITAFCEPQGFGD